jgi:DNA mismatch repair ATPase MutS
MESILQDSGLENISEILNTKLYFKDEVIRNLLLKSCNFPNQSNIVETQDTIYKLSLINEDLQPYFDNLETREKECEYFFSSTKSLDSLEDDTFGQLIFTNEYFKHLNFIPFLLLLLTYFKKICIPLISIVFPLIAYFLPMLLIKYVWKMPINLNLYNKIMSKIVSFDISSPEKILQNLFTIFTLFQSVYQILQNALHLHTIDTNIVKLGETILNYNETVEKIKSILKKNSIRFSFSKTFEDLYDDTRRVFVQIKDESYRFILLAKDLAKLELFWKLAKNTDISKVSLYSSNTPYFKADEIYDINLSNEKRVASSIEIKKDSQHFLLSGPNGGGKSSFLRAILQTLLFSHAFGYAFGKNIQLSPFDFILSGLSIHDTPGKLSLFEKEICFARNVLYYNNPDYKGFILFDEIFHSTNPPDGIRTSQLFLNTLWNFNHMASIVSTHVFEIIEQSPDSVKKICVDAEKVNGLLKYNYSIKNGISRLSSVDEIWKKKFVLDA